MLHGHEVLTSPLDPIRVSQSGPAPLLKKTQSIYSMDARSHDIKEFFSHHNELQVWTRWMCFGEFVVGTEYI